MEATSPKGARSGTWLLSCLSLIACIYLFCRHLSWSLYTNPDAGWLIQTGQYLLDGGARDRLPFNWFGSPHMVAYQWLFEVVSAQIFQFGSIWLFGLVACIAAGILLLFVMPRIWIAKGIPMFLPFLALCFIQTPNWFQARPQLVSYFFSLAFLSVLERYRLGRNWKILIVLPLLSLLWANIHLFWTVGLLFVGVYLGCDWRRQRKIDKPLAASLAGSVLATLINPYGIGLIGYTCSLINSPQYMHVWEMLPSYASLEGALAFLPVALALCVMIILNDEIPAEGFVLTLVTALAALFARRFQPLAIITCWTYLGLALSAVDWSQYGRTTGPRRALQWCLAVVAVAVPIVGWSVQVPNITAAWMLYTENSLPLLYAAAHSLDRDDRLFNDPTLGSWLIAMHRLPVFVDTRFDMFSSKFLQRMNDCLEARNGWATDLDRWSISQILVRDEEPLNQALMYSGDWKLALHDGHFAWWIRQTQHADVLLDDLHLSDGDIRSAKLPPPLIQCTIEARAAKYLLLARLHRSRHENALALQDSARGLLLMPDSSALNTERQLSSNGTESQM